MFRTGGLSQGTGITSGLDTPRIGYAGGGRTYGGGMIHGKPLLKKLEQQKNQIDF